MVGEQKTDPAGLFLADSTRITIPQIPEYAGRVTDKLEQKAKEMGLKTTGPCVFFYFGADGNPNTEFELVVGIPVDAEKGNPAPFKFKKTPPFKCYSTMYKGGMPGIGGAWGDMMGLAHEAGVKITGEGREVYHKWVDFESNDNLTELQISIA